tara:strand:+ start:1342 stop:2436 length:1095 start_codon:yes stop_codon:yes gene_type:complete
MNKSDAKIYYLYIAISFIFILVTTDYLSLYDIIHVANQTDVNSYNEIAINAPSLPQEDPMVIKNVAQRFLIPYIVGSIAYFFNIDFFLIFKFFTFIFIIFYIFLINILIKKLNFNLKVSILFFSILFLNPYLIRYHIFQPVQAHDMLFFCLGLVFFITIISKNYFINLLTTVIAIYLRQTSIALIIGSGIFLFINKKIKLLMTLFLLSFLSLYLIFQIAEKISSDPFPIHLAYRLFYYDFTQYEKLLKFLLLGLMPFTPLLVVLFGKFNKNIKISSVLTLLFVCSMIIGQPIIGGPDGSINNVGRIANLGYPILTCLCFYIWNFEKFVERNYLFYIFIILMFLWSLHPTFSIFKSFGIFRFYNY